MKTWSELKENLGEGYGGYTTMSKKEHVQRAAKLQKNLDSLDQEHGNKDRIPGTKRHNLHVQIANHKRKSELVEAVLPTNKQFGFLGTAGDKSHELVDKAVAHIRKANEGNKNFKMSDQTISHYLDSKGGRHLADLMMDGADDDQIHKALKNSIGEFAKMYNPSLYEDTFTFELIEAINGMTNKAHAEKTRELRQKIEAHKAAMHKAIDAHGDAVRELERHRMHDPKYVVAKQKQAAKDGPYYEQGRSRMPGPSSHGIHEGVKKILGKRVIKENDPHLSRVHAAAMSTAGRAAAAKRAEADRKAREAYLAKKNGTSPAAEPAKAAEPEKPKKQGILHSNAAKAREHWAAIHRVMSKPMPAKSASEKLKPHVDDHRLHSDLAHFEKHNPDIDVRPLVKKHLERIRKTG